MSCFSIFIIAFFRVLLLYLFTLSLFTYIYIYVYIILSCFLHSLLPRYPSKLNKSLPWRLKSSSETSLQKRSRRSFSICLQTCPCSLVKHPESGIASSVGGSTKCRIVISWWLDQAVRIAARSSSIGSTSRTVSRSQDSGLGSWGIVEKGKTHPAWWLARTNTIGTREFNIVASIERNGATAIQGYTDGTGTSGSTYQQGMLGAIDVINPVLVFYENVVGVSEWSKNQAGEKVRPFVEAGVVSEVVLHWTGIWCFFSGTSNCKR